jgi:hypothetical protein
MSSREFCLNADFHVTFRDLLHAANLRHGIAGFTSPAKEGVLGIFSPWKIQRLRPGLNPRTWVLEASTNPLDHRSRSDITILRPTSTSVHHHLIPNYIYSSLGKPSRPFFDFSEPSWPRLYAPSKWTVYQSWIYVEYNHDNLKSRMFAVDTPYPTNLTKAFAHISTWEARLNTICKVPTHPM